MSFLEEMWSRNLGHLFVDPLRPTEFVAALMVMSLARVIGLPVLGAGLSVSEFSVFSYGPGIVAFSPAFVMGWGSAWQ